MSLLNYSGPLTPDEHPVQVVPCGCGEPLLHLADPTGFALIVGLNHGFPHPLIFTEALVAEEEAQDDDYAFEENGKVYSWADHTTCTEVAYRITCPCGQSQTFIKTHDGGILLPNEVELNLVSIPIPIEVLPYTLDPLPEWDVDPEEAMEAYLRSHP